MYGGLRASGLAAFAWLYGELGGSKGLNQAIGNCPSVWMIWIGMRGGMERRESRPQVSGSKRYRLAQSHTLTQQGKADEARQKQREVNE
jgi:phage gp37-like protein